MNWYYIDGPRRLGPLSESEWAALVHAGKIQPETLVWHEALDGWIPYGKVPVPEPVSPEPPPLPEPEEPLEPEEETPTAYSERMLKREYTVEIGSCLNRAWRLLGSHFWMLVGSTLLMSAIVIFSAQVEGLNFFMGMALQGVLFAGLYVVYLRLMRGRPAAVKHLAAGFDVRVFRHLSLKTLIAFMVTNACFIPMIVALKKAGVTVDNLSAKLISDPNSVLIVMLVAAACLVPVIFFSFIWMFALPLIIDKKLPCWKAMELSRKKIMQHPFRVGLLTIVAGIAGIIGFVFTIPVYIASTLYLYEDIFWEPGKQEEDDEPEPDENVDEE